MIYFDNKNTNMNYNYNHLYNSYLNYKKHIKNLNILFIVNSIDNYNRFNIISQEIDNDSSITIIHIFSHKFINDLNDINNNNDLINIINLINISYNISHNNLYNSNKYPLISNNILYIVNNVKEIINFDKCDDNVKNTINDIIFFLIDPTYIAIYYVLLTKLLKLDMNKNIFMNDSGNSIGYYRYLKN